MAFKKKITVKIIAGVLSMNFVIAECRRFQQHGFVAYHLMKTLLYLYALCVGPQLPQVSLVF